MENQQEMKDFLLLIGNSSRNFEPGTSAGSDNQRETKFRGNPCPKASGDSLLHLSAETRYRYRCATKSENYLVLLPV